MALAPGARLLPMHHITIRVPWHDSGWAGTVCTRPCANTSCTVLRRIGEEKDAERERRVAGRRLDDVPPEDLPPCVYERVSFMAPFGWVRTLKHPYVETSPRTHGHLLPTPFEHPAYSAACVPYRWMLRGVVEGNAEKGEIGLAERLRIGYEPDREPDLPFESAWVQDRENQRVLLDTFFGALRPQESLCFFYAKHSVSVPGGGVNFGPQQPGTGAP